LNYQKHYNLLINRAKNRYITEYTENHHILPKCIGGSNNKSNLVRLTPEEHFVAHQLLVKIYPNCVGLIRAASRMTVSSYKNVRNNKLYGWLRRRFAKAMSKTQLGSRNSQYGSMWITNGIFNKKIDKESLIPEGFEKGRTVFSYKKNTLCVICNSGTGSTKRKYCDLHRYSEKTCTPETKNKLKEHAKNKIGKLNNQFGTVWVNNGIKNKKIKKGTTIPDGWELGQINKRNKKNSKCNICQQDTGHKYFRRCDKHRYYKTEEHCNKLSKNNGTKSIGSDRRL
jgi:hypothetical protein